MCVSLLLFMSCYDTSLVDMKFSNYFLKDIEEDSGYNN